MQFSSQHHFLKKLLRFLRSNEIKVFNLTTSNLYTSDFNLFKLTVIVFNFSLSNLSTSSFKPAESTFFASFEASTPASFFNF